MNLRAALSILALFVLGISAGGLLVMTSITSAPQARHSANVVIATALIALVSSGVLSFALRRSAMRAARPRRLRSIRIFP